MEESATIKMAQLARDLGRQGKQVINLSLGEPDFGTPQHIVDACKEALDEGYTKYTPVPGLLELREAICRKFRRDNDLEFTPDQIVVSNGAKQSIANLCLALLNEGDEVIILTPYWVSYSEIVKMAGGVPVFVKGGIEQDFKARADQIEAAITERTKALLFSSPCNPTGSVFSRDELQAIARMAENYEQLHLISDEIYEYINFTDQHHSIGSFPEVRERTVTINGFSKGFAMTGWRLGYMGAPAWLAAACAKIQGQFTSGANAFGQKAAAHALEADMKPTQEMKAAFRRRRDLIIQLLENIPGLKVNRPAGAFYIFPDVSDYFGKSDGQMTIRDSVDFCEYILTDAHVAIVPGGAFGAENCIRISYAASEEQIRQATDRIGRSLQRLR